MHFRYLLYLITFTTLAFANKNSLLLQKIDDTHWQTHIQLPASEQEMLYVDYIQPTIDHPQVSIESWQTQEQPTSYFDPKFKETKKIFNKPITIHLTLAGQESDVANTHVQIQYTTTKQQHIKQMAYTWPTSLLQSFEGQAILNEGDTSTLKTTIDIPEDMEVQEKVPSEQNQPKKSSYYDHLQSLLQQSNSRFLQFLIIFLLGLLMSLTPCIYPMIPITAGILQGHGSKSIMTNFLLASSYTAGLATTFASLGLLAAWAGKALGSFMTNPFFIIPLVMLLAYLAFSLFGFYEMWTPKFLKPKNQTITGGSFISAFIFGVISGSVASPCLSPGLVLLLSMVATLQNIFLGFFMLFIFGLGLGVPLLLIGTFSSSLGVLPRAGLWMVEIKKVFGILLLAMCFYFLSYILPLYILLWCLTLFVLVMGIIYVQSSTKAPTIFLSRMKSIIGILLIAASVVLAFKSYQQMKMNECADLDSIWLHDYTCAHEKALQQHKLLFIDIGSPFCSICKAIDKTLFADERVIKTLQQTVMVKIDGSKSENESLLHDFKVVGFPTILLMSPEKNQIIKRFGPELYDVEPGEFIRTVNMLIDKHS